MSDVSFHKTRGTNRDVVSKPWFNFVLVLVLKKWGLEACGLDTLVSGLGSRTRTVFWSWRAGCESLANLGVVRIPL